MAENFNTLVLLLVVFYVKLYGYNSAELECTAYLLGTERHERPDHDGTRH